MNNEGEKHQLMSPVNTSATVGLGYSPITWLFAISECHLGLHGEAQFGGVLGVTLAINQHQGVSLVVLYDVGDTAEILQKKQEQTRKRIKLE